MLCMDIEYKMSHDQRTKFMTQRGADPIKKILNKKNATEGHRKTMRILVENINKTKHRSLGTVFLFAARNNDVKLGKLVLSKAKDEKMKKEIMNKKGDLSIDKDNVALHECAKIENLPFLEYLLSIIKDDSAQFMAKDIRQRSALMIAVNNNNRNTSYFMCVE